MEDDDPSTQCSQSKMIFFVILLAVAFYVLERIVPSRQIPTAVGHVLAMLCVYVIGEALWLPLMVGTSGWIDVALGPDSFRRHSKLLLLGPPLIPAVLLAVVRLVRKRENGT
jgi:thiol:disulfide interchange protein